MSTPICQNCSPCWLKVKLHSMFCQKAYITATCGLWIIKSIKHLNCAIHDYNGKNSINVDVFPSARNNILNFKQIIFRYNQTSKWDISRHWLWKYCISFSLEQFRQHPLPPVENGYLVSLHFFLCSHSLYIPSDDAVLAWVCV